MSAALILLVLSAATGPASSIGPRLRHGNDLRSTYIILIAHPTANQAKIAKATLPTKTAGTSTPQLRFAGLAVSGIWNSAASRSREDKFETIGSPPELPNSSGTMLTWVNLEAPCRC
jgi:hypothetical protein